MIDRTIIIFGIAPTGLYKEVRTKLLGNRWLGGTATDANYNNMPYVYEKTLSISDEDNFTVPELAEVNDWGMYVAILNDVGTLATHWRLIGSKEWIPMDQLSLKKARTVLRKTQATENKNKTDGGGLVWIAVMTTELFVNTTRDRDHRDLAKPVRDARLRRGWIDTPKNTTSTRPLSSDEITEYQADPDKCLSGNYNKVVNELIIDINKTVYRHGLVLAVSIVDTKTGICKISTPDTKGVKTAYNKPSTPMIIKNSVIRINNQFSISDVVFPALSDISATAGIGRFELVDSNVKLSECDVVIDDIHGDVGLPQMLFDRCTFLKTNSSKYLVFSGLCAFDNCTFHVGSLETVNTNGGIIVRNGKVPFDITVHDKKDYPIIFDNIHFEDGTRLVLSGSTGTTIKFDKCSFGLFTLNYTNNNNANFELNECEGTDFQCLANRQDNNNMLTIRGGTINTIQKRPPIKAIGKVNSRILVIKTATTQMSFFDECVGATITTTNAFVAPAQDSHIFHLMLEHLVSKETSGFMMQTSVSGLNRYNTTIMPERPTVDEASIKSLDWLVWWNEFIKHELAPYIEAPTPSNYDETIMFVGNYYKMLKLMTKSNQSIKR